MIKTDFLVLSVAPFGVNCSKWRLEMTSSCHFLSSPCLASAAMWEDGDDGPAVDPPLSQTEPRAASFISTLTVIIFISRVTYNIKPFWNSKMLSLWLFSLSLRVCFFLLVAWFDFSKWHGCSKVHSRSTITVLGDKLLFTALQEWTKPCAPFWGGGELLLTNTFVGALGTRFPLLPSQLHSWVRKRCPCCISDLIMMRIIMEGCLEGSVIEKNKTASEIRLIMYNANATTGQRSTVREAVWPSYVQLWHYCPHFARLMTLAHTLLQIMGINASLISFLMPQLQAEVHFFTFLITGER